MSRTAIVAESDRETLPDVLSAGPAAAHFAERSLAAFMDQPLPARSVLAGFWNDKNGDPFPDFLIVNDEDLGDTLAWLSSYAAGLAPITQWCRLWSRTQARELMRLPAKPALGERLAPWVGAIIAECSVQARMQINLKALSGAAALSSASFSAARASAVWQEFNQFAELGRRHDELFSRLRDGRDRCRQGGWRGCGSRWRATAGPGVRRPRSAVCRCSARCSTKPRTGRHCPPKSGYRDLCGS